MIETLSISSSKRIEFIDITSQINAIIKKNKIEEGICFLHVPHTTAGITINENADPDVVADITSKTAKIFPKNDNYYHIEGNSDAHIKSSIFGQTLNLIINNAKLLLGTWQCVYFCEFDGPRNRKLYIKLVNI